MSLQVATLLAIIISAAGVLAIRRYAGQLPLAAVNDRSLHGVPVSRIGGLALWAAWLPLAALTLPESAWMIPLVLIMAVSALDDWRGVHPALRFLLQFAAGAWWVAQMASTQPMLTQLFWILLLAWSANLYNFMDGIDGLAAFMALVGFGAYAIAAGGAWIDGRAGAILMVAAIVPILAANWPPAKIFIGDVGAVPLGFLAAVFGMEGATHGAWPFWFPLLVFAPFWADASFTLCKRLVNREKIWQAHREHGYQKLVLLGFGHVGALAVYGMFMVGCASSALYALFFKPEAGLVLLELWTGLLLLTMVGINVSFARTRLNGHDSKR